jgi:hypothetical protein
MSPLKCTSLASVPRELETRVLETLASVTDAELLDGSATPRWLIRPGIVECATAWDTVAAIYRRLTDMELPSTMPARERRRVDAVLYHRDESWRLVEVDESQHFTSFRASTLREYPVGTPLAFDRALWLRRSEAELRLPGGGFARPCPPLFPGDGGRHSQRAFRDALADLLPPAHGWRPTLRIGYFEVEPWIWGPRAESRMASFVHQRLTDGGGSEAM